MAKPLRYQETSEEIILNMDEELFKMKKGNLLNLILGLLCLWTCVGFFVAGISGWILYSLSNRIPETEIWLKEKYEKQARKKGKRLVITYNSEGQQFYQR